jgi:methylthioribose-1-phosphate isomerase
MARREDTEGASDPTRRQFFRTFGQQTVRNAGAVMGAAAELRRAGGVAARELLDTGGPVTVDAVGPIVADEPQTPFRSAYRLDDDSLLVLDQRDLPGRVTIIPCFEPTEVVSAIRSRAINGGPVLAEVAAYALSMTVARSVKSTGQSRDQAVRAAANTLRGARDDVHALRAAVDRMEGRYDALTADASPSEPTDLAGLMRSEADAIATEATLAHAALGRAGADVLAARIADDPTRTPGAPINLLMHSDMGPLSCGMVGTGTRLLGSLVGLGHSVHVWVTEAAPSMEGARTAALQLTQADIPHTVIADSAVGWLLASRRLDGVLVRGDTVCGNGDTAALIGSLNVAWLAASVGAPVYVVAPQTAFDSEAADGRGLALDLRSPAELMAASAGSYGHSRPAVFGVRLNPTIDLVPIGLITAYLTDAGPRPGNSA